MICYDDIIVSRILSYTECERIDIDEIERIEKAAKLLWQGRP